MNHLLESSNPDAALFTGAKLPQQPGVNSLEVIEACWGTPFPIKSDIQPKQTTPEHAPLKPSDFTDFLVQALRGVAKLELKEEEPIAHGPSWKDQDEIITKAVGEKITNKAFMDERIEGPVTMGLSRQRLLREYASLQMSRAYALTEQKILKGGVAGEAGTLQFYVHDAGWEVLFRSIHAAEVAAAMKDQNGDTIKAENQAAQDPLYLHYRTTTAAILRGVDIRAMAAQDFHTVDDTMTKGRVLAGHIVHEEGSIPPITSDTGPHFYPAVGTAQALAERKLKDDTNGYARFSAKDPVTYAVTGEATVAGQDQVIGAIQQSFMHDNLLKEAWTQKWLEENPEKKINEMPEPEGLGIVFVIGNNNAGISMGLKSTSIKGDPIYMYRYIPDLKVIEVDGDDIENMSKAALEAHMHAKNKKGPVLLHVKELPAITDHTSSSDRSRYFTEEEHIEHMKRDPLPKYKQYLIDHGVADEETLNKIDAEASELVQTVFDETLKKPYEDPKRLHEDVYVAAGRITYAKETVSHHQPPAERLRIPRDPRAKYIDYDNLKTDGPWLTLSQQVAAAWGYILAEDPRFIYYGEDIGTFNRNVDLKALGETRILEAAQIEQFSKEQLHDAKRALSFVLKNKSLDADPQGMAILSAVMKGKGGVFGTAQNLELLFGGDRVFNAPISEAYIIGSAAGRYNTKGKDELSKGQIPIVQIQFGSYAAPAAEQIQHVLNQCYRSGSQFPCAPIIEIQDMKRVGAGKDVRDTGGVGGIGHGKAWIYEEATRAGGVVLAPSNGMEAAGMIHEAARLARMGVPSFVVQPISLMKADVTRYQGKTHVPVGEARIIKPPQGIIKPETAFTKVLVVTHSNNVRIVEAAAEIVAREGIYVTTADTRGNIGRQFDYEGILPEMESAKRAMIMEAGPGGDARVILENMNHGAELLDRPVVILRGADTPTPAGRQYEGVDSPQLDETVHQIRRLAYS